MTEETSPPVQSLDGRLSDEQRNGSITGTGIVLGFSLAFLAQWALAPGEWLYASTVVLIVAGIGAFVELRAFFRLMAVPSLTINEHARVSAAFVRGVGLVLIGYVLNFLVGLAAQKGWFPIP
jgi:hypothetical protein